MSYTAEKAQATGHCGSGNTKCSWLLLSYSDPGVTTVVGSMDCRGNFLTFSTWKLARTKRTKQCRRTAEGLSAKAATFTNITTWLYSPTHGDQEDCTFSSSRFHKQKGKSEATCRFPAQGQIDDL